MPDQLLSIASNYSNLALTGDGLPEINSLSYLPFESEYPEPPVSARLALVLVEPRLLDTMGDATLRPALLRALRRFKGDLRAEGLFSRFFLANIYDGTVHKDGRVLLALRRFLRDVRATFGKLEGVVLIGRFPDSTLVRRVSWCPGFLAPRQLAIWPEIISERADIVLSDLTGTWESVYRQNDFHAESITATPDAATTSNGWFDGEAVRNCEFSSNTFTRGQSGPFRDAFYLDDAMYQVLEHTDLATSAARPSEPGRAQRRGALGRPYPGKHYRETRDRRLAHQRAPRGGQSQPRDRRQRRKAPARRSGKPAEHRQRLAAVRYRQPVGDALQRPRLRSGAPTAE